MKTFYTDGTGSQQTLNDSQTEKVVVYDTINDAEADLVNLAEGQIIATKDDDFEGNAVPVNEVTLNNMHSVTSNAVANYIKTKDVPFTLSANSWSTSSAGVLYNNVVDVEQSIGSDKTILGFYLIGATSANYLISFYLRTNGKYISALATSQNASMSGTIRIIYIS